MATTRSTPWQAAGSTGSTSSTSSLACAAVVPGVVQRVGAAPLLRLADLAAH